MPSLNWRQTPRTALDEGTTSAVFILDALAPVTDDAMHAAADELVSALTTTASTPANGRRLIGPA